VVPRSSMSGGVTTSATDSVMSSLRSLEVPRRTRRDIATVVDSTVCLLLNQQPADTHSLKLIHHTRHDMELGHWVTGSMGHLGHLSRPCHRVIILTRCETRDFPVFEKTQHKDIKIYFFVKIRPAVIEILTFNK